MTANHPNSWGMQLIIFPKFMKNYDLSDLTEAPDPFGPGAVDQLVEIAS